MKLASLYLLLSFFQPAQAFQGVIHVESQKVMTYDQMTKSFERNAVIVLGENHYDPLATAAQAQIITSVRQVTLAGNLAKPLYLGWEFLDYPNQVRNQAVFLNYTSDLVTEEGLLRGILPNPNQAKAHQVYLPLFRSLKTSTGLLGSLNLPRVIKQKLIAEGWDAIADWVPLHYQPCSNGYFERFVEAMADHVPVEKMEAYFDAQCLTDEVMSDQALALHASAPLVLVMGAFHMEYGDGVVEKLKEKTLRPVRTIRILADRGISEAEALKLARPSPEYGDVAEWIYFP